MCRSLNCLDNVAIRITEKLLCHHFYFLQHLCLHQLYMEASSTARVWSGGTWAVGERGRAGCMITNSSGFACMYSR